MKASHPLKQLLTRNFNLKKIGHTGHFLSFDGPTQQEHWISLQSTMTFSRLIEHKLDGTGPVIGFENKDTLDNCVNNPIDDGSFPVN
jgi:hypothetical protein